MTKLARAYLDLTIAMIIVGSSVVVGKIITDAFPLFLASGVRFGIASAFLLIVTRNHDEGLRSIQKRDWIILILMALSGQFAFTLCLLWGLRLTGSAEAGLIISTTPAVMAVLSHLVFKEWLPLTHLIGIAMAILGVLVVNGILPEIAKSPLTGHFAGNLIVFGAVLGEGLFLLLRKSIKSTIPNLTLACALCLLGMFMSLPVGLYEARSFALSAVTLQASIAMIYFGLVFTVVAYGLWFRGVTEVSGATASIFTAVMPVSAVVLSYLFLGEQFRWSHLVGGVLIVGAIAIMALGPVQSRRDSLD